MYFPSFSNQTRLLTLPAPHEIPSRELQEYPFCSELYYLTYAFYLKCAVELKMYFIY